MRRRRFLALTLPATTAFAGCSSDQPLTDASATATAEPRGAVSLASVMGTPDSFPGAFSVEVTQPYATSDLAPRVLVTLRNTAEEAVMFGSGNYVPFSGFVSVEGSPEAYLYPDRYRNDGGCVFAAGKGLPSADIYAQAELGPEETASELYGVWHAEPEADGCLPAGEYAFRSDDYGVDRFENGTPAGEPPEEWGFTLQFEQT